MISFLVSARRILGSVCIQDRAKYHGDIGYLLAVRPLRLSIFKSIARVFAGDKTYVKKLEDSREKIQWIREVILIVKLLLYSTDISSHWIVSLQNRLNNKYQ